MQVCRVVRKEACSCPAAGIADYVLLFLSFSGWDGADCGVDKVYRDIPGVTVNGSVTEPLTSPPYAPTAADSVHWLWDYVVMLVLSETENTLASRARDHPSTIEGLCHNLSLNASSAWLDDRVVRALSVRELHASPVTLDSSVLSAYVNLSAVLNAAHQRSASELVAVSAASRSGLLNTAVQAVCKVALTEPSCGLGKMSHCHSWELLNSSTTCPGLHNMTANESAAVFQRESKSRCRSSALFALQRGWNATTFDEYVASVRSNSKSFRSTSGAEYSSSGGVKSAVFSTHYDLLILMFNGDTLDALAPLVSAKHLASQLPSSDKPPFLANVGSSNNSSACNSSEIQNGTLCTAAALNATEMEAANARWRDAISRVAPFASAGDAAFAVMLTSTLNFPNGSENSGLASNRHLLFNATLLRRTRVSFSDSEAFNLTDNITAVSPLNCSSVCNVSKNATNATVDVCCRSDLPEQPRLLRSIVASRRRIDSVPKRSSKSVLSSLETQSLRLARATADEALQRLARTQSTNTAEVVAARRALVSTAWAAVSEAVAAEASLNDNPLALYADFVSAESAETVAAPGVDSLSALAGNDHLPSLAAPSVTFSRGRRLEDTYADSLVHTTRLIASKLGRKSSRRVPAHMPHMIDRVISALRFVCFSVL